MTEPKKQTKSEMLKENARRIASACAQASAEIENCEQEGKIEVTLDFLQTLLRQRRRIRGGQADVDH